MKRIGEIMPGIQDRIAQMQATQRAWTEQVNASVEANVHECSTHGTDITINRRESVASSIKSGTLTLVWNRCQQCAADDAEQATRAMLEQAGVPPALVHASFEGFVPANDSQQLAMKGAATYAANPVGFFWLTGNPGTGKSHLAVSIMRVVSGTGIRVGFIEHNTLVNLYRDSYANLQGARSEIRQWQNRGLLVLDDLGATGMEARDATQILHTLFAFRFGEKLPTVITTNLDKKGVRAAVGDRIKERFRECFAGGVAIVGDSQRHNARQTYIREIGG